MSDNIKIATYEPPAGCYEITPGFQVYIDKKPFWFFRVMTKLLLGWKWRDKEE